MIQNCKDCNTLLENCTCIEDTINMKQETLEEAAIINYKKLYEGEPLTQEVPIDAFINGSKWQQERSYSDMQEYAMFCIECDRKKMPLLLVEDWYKHYKK